MVETDRYRVEGMMTLPREGYRSRVSDHVNRRDTEFFTMVDCELVSLDGSGRDLIRTVRGVGYVFSAG